jgi:hypothetical protein
MNNTIENLKKYNLWRRGDELIEQPDPKDIGIWIDEICEKAVKTEREREEARKEVEFLKKTPLRQRCQELERLSDHWCDMHTIAAKERDEAQKELSSIYRWIERNHADGFIDSLTYLQNLERVTDNWYDRIDAIEKDSKRFVRELDEAREQNAKLRDIAERAMLFCDMRMRDSLRAELEQLKEGAK